ncbi:MAG: hypothetical protein Q8936_10740 [Bacillota bacterium]|nr:hypothetical protein [Bacillota bacterium]
MYKLCQRSMGKLVGFYSLSKFITEQPNERDALHRWLMFLMKPNKAVLEVIERADPAIRKAHNVLEIRGNGISKLKANR